jgi:hypothetical protein
MRLTPAYSFKLDTEALAAALAIPEDAVVPAFRDGRVSSRFSELWAAKCFGIVCHKNTNNRSTDCFVEMPDGDKVEIAVRTLTRSIRFQDSIFIGGGRKRCTLADLKQSIRRSDRWFVCDVRDFPEVRFYKIKSSVLEKWIDNGELTPSGLSAKRFTELLNRDARPMLRQLDFL